MTTTPKPVPSASDAQTFLTKVKAIAGKLAALIPAGTQPADAGGVLGEIQNAISFASSVAAEFFPGAEIAGFAVSKALALAGALASAAPDAMAAFEAAQAAVNGGAAPTPEQWAALDAAADAAHQGLQAAADAFLAGSQAPGAQPTQEAQEAPPPESLAPGA